jgi:dTDP-4-dehydrorhamnose 3,5-epimerase-like enzyme
MSREKPKIQFLEIPNKGDSRGFSFTIPSEALAYVGNVADVHVSSIKAGAVRGNHYHVKLRQAIVVLPGSKWSFHWDEGEGTPTQNRTFDGSTAILVLVAVDASHALRNEGDSILWLTAISSDVYDPAGRVARKVV